MHLSHQVSVNINFSVNGSVDSETSFLLFNGATLPLEFWGECAESLSELGRVIRFDQRNAGKTEFSGNFTLGDVAADAVALLDHLGIEQVVAVGHPWGGRVAQVFARDYPNRLSQLVIIGTGGQLPPVDMRSIAAPMRQAEKDQDRAVWEPLFEAMWFGHGFAGREPATFKRVADLLWQYQPPRSAVWETQAFPSKHYWGTASVPTLLIYGDEDKNGTLENAQALHRQLADSKLVIIENTGHFVVREAPYKVTSEIQQFLQKTTS